jgi:2-polyprenyl-3-methyl-5-hydroxy-6-metoxy-1,4-benzoquinol methylase
MAQTYVGNELELFAKASNWKAYWGECIRPFVKGRVLDVGAGIGATISVLFDDSLEGWLALEPDPSLADKIRARMTAGELPECCEVISSTVQALDKSRKFDTILYVDVLEHINDDRAEMLRAADRLAEGGSIIVLSPAHQWLFTAFDEALGHYRRYNRSTLRRVGAPTLEVERILYLDSVGIAASLGNKLLLRSSQPTEDQILLWDRWMVPVSRITDAITGYRLGKSIVGVWRKPLASSERA